MNESDICIDCNLCCSAEGLTLNIYPGEENLIPVKHIELYFDTYSPSGGTRVVYGDFQQVKIPVGGCPNLNKNGHCGIYEKRPRTCAEFRCGPLKKYSEGDMSLKEIQELIQRGKKEMKTDPYFFKTNFLEQ
jgi:Fe-S-cluster containining protein|tara:strand:+ start:381 stop:776 length:396 start_codon:yes stop_codon:yes gene_type:complete